MSLKNTEMHVVSLFGAAVVSAALVVPVVWVNGCNAGASTPPLADNRQVIEATLAYKSTKKKQPEKKRDVVEEVKVEGVSRDENKKVEPKKEEKKEEKKPVVDPKDPFKGIRRPDEDAGKPTTQPEGEFDGSEKGFAPESRGDRYFAELRADMNFTFPEIAKAQSIPIGCIHLQPDGRIKATTFAPPIGKTGDDDIQIAAEAALKQLQQNRNRDPKPVPTYLLSVTKQWLCFKFSVSSG